MKKILMISLLLLPIAVMASSEKIVPADKEKIVRHVGESVFVQCKNLSPFSKNCQVDCGNGLSYRKAKGYCHYLTEGKFVLNVSSRYRGRNYKHTAFVEVTHNEKKSVPSSDNTMHGKKQEAPMTSDEHRPKVTPSKPLIGNELKLKNIPVAPNAIVSDSSKNNADGVPTNFPVLSADDLQNNNINNVISDINLNLDGGVNQTNIGAGNNQLNTDFNQNSFTPTGESNPNFNNQNVDNDRFIQR